MDWARIPELPGSSVVHGWTALPGFTSVVILYIVLPASLLLIHSFPGNLNLFNEAAVLFWSPVLGLSHFFRSRFTLLGCFSFLMFKGILLKSSSLTRRRWWHFFFSSFTQGDGGFGSSHCHAPHPASSSSGTRLVSRACAHILRNIDTGLI